MSLIDARTLPTGHRIESDVCIIGGGAAGLAIASRFFGRSDRVVVLESGGTEPDPETQSLYQGPSVGRAHTPLDQCRLRYLGGTTNHWTAHVRPLDPIDFEPRPWVPHSGWPFGPSELESYYELTRTFLHLPERPFDVEAWQSPERKPWGFRGARLQNWVRQILPESRRRLGPILRPDLASSGNVDTYLFANVLRIELNESRKRVERLHIRTLSGRELSARARYVVLATGAIENARVLLLSDIRSPADPAEDLVGRFYANHPDASVGLLALTRPNIDGRFYTQWTHPSGEGVGYLSLSAEAQRKHQLLGCSINLREGPRGARVGNLGPNAMPPPMPGSPIAEVTGGEVALRQLDRDIVRVSSDMDDSRGPSGLRGDSRVAAAPNVMALKVVAEPSPNPASRVRLGDLRDPFGQRRVVLDWRLALLDSSSVTETLRVAAREMGAAGLARVRITFRGDGFRSASQSRIGGSHHHMGTTRMQRDPRRGVVDENCRVHGISNLFVAGSSVFPTYGIANPTYTILALAFRLAAHLRERLA